MSETYLKDKVVPSIVQDVIRANPWALARFGDQRPLEQSSRVQSLNGRLRSYQYGTEQEPILFLWDRTGNPQHFTPVCVHPEFKDDDHRAFEVLRQFRASYMNEREPDIDDVVECNPMVRMRTDEEKDAEARRQQEAREKDKADKAAASQEELRTFIDREFVKETSGKDLSAATSTVSGIEVEPEQPRKRRGRPPKELPE